MKHYHSPYLESYAQGDASGENYDKGISNNFELTIFELEKKILLLIFNRWSQLGSNLSLLDYACGTGRILSVLKDVIPTKVGMDASAIQLKKAKEKNIGAELILGNIVTESQLLSGRKFSFITSFRLFLNLEKKNRVPVLKGLYDVLDENGVLILDNHMNRYSLLGMVAWFMRKVLGYKKKSQLQPGERGIIDTMSEGELRGHLAEAGFVVREVHRLFVLPGNKNILLLPRNMLIKLEEKISNTPVLNKLSKNQIFVCQKKL
ncbi:MAG: hypothetical protein NPIRA01_33280 [Nitrospirales bacterium]|nr:MAG: hypothetical protein NPIRA01_33280 [Nitrospirales bacterium]